MAGARVLVSGMGGDLGSRVAVAMEDEEWVGALVGIDADPPRRRLRRAVFHRIDPIDHDRTVETITAFDPHVLVHMSVWEPHSRANPAAARRLTDLAAGSILGAAAECRSLEAVVVRSGIEIYGRGRDAPTRPDEDSPIAPTSGYGRTLARIEATASELGRRIGVSVGTIRSASVLGPHVPSPLGRILRMPAVPFSAVSDPPFTVVQDQLNAQAFVAAAARRLDQPVNVAATGSITAFQAARRGHKLPVPVIGPQWVIAKAISAILGAPVPDHVSEMFRRGRLADNGRMDELLGITAESTTSQVIDQLYAWPSVVRVPATVKAA